MNQKFKEPIFDDEEVPKIAIVVEKEETFELTCSSDEAEEVSNNYPSSSRIERPETRKDNRSN